MNKNNVKYLTYSVIILNALDAIITSFFISTHSIYEEANPFLVYLFEKINYNIILFLKVILIAVILLTAHKYIISSCSYWQKYYKTNIILLVFLNVLLFGVVLGNVSTVIFW